MLTDKNIITERMGSERKELYLKLEKYAYSYFDRDLDEIHTSLIMADDDDDLTNYHEILNACEEFERKIQNFFATGHVKCLEELGFEVTLKRKKEE